MRIRMYSLLIYIDSASIVHMFKPFYFRLMAAMFDLPVIPTSESIHTSLIVLILLGGQSKGTGGGSCPPC